MPRLSHLALLVAALSFIGGCCRDTIREMASLKDTNLRPQQRTSKVAPERATKAAKVEREDDHEDEIETGSINKPDCQGQHLAYQATKEYLKNFGPKPPDLPGERGPCNPDN
ncbi:hypothetical protein [Hyphomicrobium sp.]|uniref:hypothetical protein n=1 Tax=Hyphomicrobium sp. TaxID=82 RepID=UPI0025C5BC3E|nr:hypothetical protein [Hyphomicrobium sp.]MCC7251183.1 hypothetical protein [Hyphomicrobium sp.]